MLCYKSPINNNDDKNDKNDDKNDGDSSDSMPEPIDSTSE